MPEGAEQALVAVRLAGPEAAVERGQHEAEAILVRETTLPLVTLPDASGAEYWQAAEDVTGVAALPPNAALLRGSVLPARVAAATEDARHLADAHGLSLAWLADLPSGTLWLRVTLPQEEAGGDPFGAALAGLQRDLLARWGQCVLLGCPPALKAALPIWGTPPPTLALMREVKRRFDPRGTLNPGRYLPGIGQTPRRGTQPTR